MGNEDLKNSPENKEILRVEGLCKHYDLHRSIYSRFSDWREKKNPPVVRALNKVSFSVFSRETLGILGESGSGKSTLARVLMGLLSPDAGSASLLGSDLFDFSRINRLKNLKRMQMVFQDPFSSLDPRQSIASVLKEPLKIHGIHPSEGYEKKLREALSEVGLEPDILTRYPAEFSGGQRQRICVSRALLLDPEILIADEAVSALDVSVQAQILELFVRLKEARGLTLIFISHDVAVIRQLSDRILVFYRGNLVETMSSECLLTDVAHPYTKKLLNAALFLREGSPILPEKSNVLKNSPLLVNDGCPFFSRCDCSDELCKSPPSFSELHPGHSVACWRSVNSK
ncbi:MAG: ABC transporter ATP-binding protein [Candidatus Riflebacteria bacterium]|nr:ABC transporter ATP-binding protein [Candidatus Riflebacteria bacterium]